MPAAFFGVSVRDAWVCDRKAKVSVYGPEGLLERSAQCREFRDKILAQAIIHCSTAGGLSGGGKTHFPPQRGRRVG
ncbi:MAG: hypothetical protein JO015_19910 [Verrucomicrobia bacterium]|nr:hypothetical protein [Verrucomicrobiota bacterium]